MAKSRRQRKSKKGGWEGSNDNTSTANYNGSTNYASSLNGSTGYGTGYDTGVNSASGYGTGVNSASGYGTGYGGRKRRRKLRGGNVGPYSANDLARHAGSYHGYPTAKAHYVGGRRRTKKRRSSKRR